MSELFELDPADGLGAGAVGDPGARAFYLQARKESAQLTVLVEKEQVALLATEAGAFLDQIDVDYPDVPEGGHEGATPLGEGLPGELQEPAVPLFRARAIGIGFDPDREMVLLEFREHGRSDGDDIEDRAERGEAESEPVAPDLAADEDGWVARVYATRSQVRAMLASGAAAVLGGRSVCPMCDFPMDPDGHQCPRWN